MRALSRGAPWEGDWVSRERILQTRRLVVTSWLASDVGGLFVAQSDA